MATRGRGRRAATVPEPVLETEPVAQRAPPQLQQDLAAHRCSVPATVGNLRLCKVLAGSPGSELSL